MEDGAGAHLTKSPTSHCVINLIPPRECWGPMQELRTLHVRESRCGPHVSFIDPFVLVEHFPEAEKILRSTLEDISPFRVHLDKFDFFEHSKKSFTLFVAPRSEPADALPNLMKTIVSLFPQCNDQLKRGNGTFVPHISIAKCTSKADLQRTLDTAQKSWIPMSFPLQEIYLLHRLGTDPFEIKYAVQLGRLSTTPLLGPSSEPAEPAVSRSLVICGLPKDMDDAKLMDLLQKGKATPNRVEMIKNPDGKTRNCGVAEYDTEDAMRRAMSDFQCPSGYDRASIYLKPLLSMAFPAEIGGSCSLDAVKLKYSDS